MKPNSNISKFKNPNLNDASNRQSSFSPLKQPHKNPEHVEITKEELKKLQKSFEEESDLRMKKKLKAYTINRETLQKERKRLVLSQSPSKTCQDETYTSNLNNYRHIIEKGYRDELMQWLTKLRDFEGKSKSVSRDDIKNAYYPKFNYIDREKKIKYRNKDPYEEKTTNTSAPAYNYYHTYLGQINNRSLVDFKSELRNVPKMSEIEKKFNRYPDRKSHISTFQAPNFPWTKKNITNLDKFVIKNYEQEVKDFVYSNHEIKLKFDQKIKKKKMIELNTTAGILGDHMGGDWRNKFVQKNFANIAHFTRSPCQHNAVTMWGSSLRLSCITKGIKPTWDFKFDGLSGMDLPERKATIIKEREVRRKRIEDYKNGLIKKEVKVNKDPYSNNVGVHYLDD